MTADLVQSSFSPASLLCRAASPSLSLASSQEAGWTSMLVVLHRDVRDEKSFETEATPDQNLTVMMRGEQELDSFNGGTWRRAVYRAGTVGLTSPGETDRLRRRFRNVASPCDKASLYLPSRALQEAAEHVRRAGQRGHGEPLTALAFHDPLISATTTALLRAMRAGAPDLYAGAAAHWLAVHLVTVHGTRLDPDDERRAAGDLSGARVGRVLELMRTRLAEPLSLTELALEAGVSKFHFSRLFREKTGTPPYAHLLQLRLEAARHLLASTDLTVQQVART